MASDTSAWRSQVAGTLTPVEKKVLDLINSGYLEAKVAKELRISRERVRQIVETLIAKNATPTPYNDTFTVIQVAKHLDIPSSMILEICKKGLIKCFKLTGNDEPGKRVVVKFRIPRDQVDLIASKLCARPKKICIICGKSFSTNNDNKITCSEKCRKARKKKPAVTKHRKDVRDPNCLSARIRRHLPEVIDGDEWITTGEALVVSRLSSGQISHLIYNHVLPTAPHPAKKDGKGKPFITICQRHIEFVDAVYSGKTTLPD